MADELFKIRFRFPNGEEFEATGNCEFIEQQRNYFLTLVGKNHSPTAFSTEPALQRARFSSAHSEMAGNTSQPTGEDSLAEMASLSILPPAQRVERTAPRQNENFPALRLWERLLKEDGDIVLLRKKMRLTAQEAALLLLAGTRVLLKKPACLALNLSRSMRKSGFNEGRLDRLLAPDIRNGHLTCEGTKRGRNYRLTNEGFAKAFVLAEKLEKESL